MNKTLAATIATALMLSACAGRSPDPVAVSQAQDNTADCDALHAEMAANREKIAALNSEGNWKVAQNVGAVAVGLFVWPVLFATDFQGAAGTDREALEQRNDYLVTLAQSRGCSEAPTVADKS